MPFENTTREALVTELCAYLRTPSVEDQCRSYAAGLNFGHDLADIAFRSAQTRAMAHLQAWMLEHGWTAGEAPDFEALLLEV
jgi:hypothetical protein